MPGTRERGIARCKDGTWRCVPDKSIVIGYIFPLGSSVVKVSYLSQQVRVSPLPLHKFLRFTEQACDPLHHGWEWASMLALTKSCVVTWVGGIGSGVFRSFFFFVRVRGGGATGIGWGGISPGGTVGRGGIDSLSVGGWSD